MATSLYARLASRGFPVWDASGQSGQGALQDSTLPGTTPPGQQEAPGTWTDPNQDPGWQPAGMAPPEAYITVGMWGLPASRKPDDTPRTHAAPLADPTLPVGAYFGEADAAHAAVFNGPQLRRDVPSVRQFALQRRNSFGSGPTNQQPLYKQPISGLGGLDAVQGYGGGGRGPGGTNADLEYDERDYPGPEGGGVQAFVSAGEVPFLTADAAQFIAVDPALGPWQGGGFDVPTATVSQQEPAGGDTPASGQPLGTGQPAYAASFWG